MLSSNKISGSIVLLSDLAAALGAKPLVSAVVVVFVC